MENALFVSDIIRSIDEMSEGNEKLKTCIKITLKKIQDKGYLNADKIKLIRQAYQNSVEDLRAVVWYLHGKADEAVLMSVERMRTEYNNYTAIVRNRISKRAHKRFYNALSEHEKALLVMRDQYGSWEELDGAIRNGVDTNPRFFAWLTKLKNGSNNLEDLVDKAGRLIEKMRSYEQANTINLADYKPSSK